MSTLTTPLLNLVGTAEEEQASLAKVMVEATSQTPLLASRLLGHIVHEKAHTYQFRGTAQAVRSTPHSFRVVLCTRAWSRLPL